MKHTKYGVVLLALLLAAMAIVPLVSAVDPGPETTNDEEDLAITVARMANEQNGGERGDVAPFRKVIPTSPLSPALTTDEDNSVPYGATIVHALVGDIPVTLVYDKDHQPLYWVDDREVQVVSSFQNLSKPVTRMHEVPAGSVINHVTPGLVTASDPKTNEVILTIIDHSSEEVLRGPGQSLVGICRENKGCYIADIYGSDTFASRPFNSSLEYHPEFSRLFDENASEMKMSVCQATPEDPYNCTDEKYSTGLSAMLNPDSESSAGDSGMAVLEIPCGWIGVSPSISSSGMAVTFGSWINWVWNPLAGVPTVDVDFHNQLIRDYGSGYTQLIRSGAYKSYTGVGLVGVTDSNTYTVSSAGDYFTLTTMDWQVPASATCIPASGSGMFQTSPNLAVP